MGAKKIVIPFLTLITVLQATTAATQLMEENNTVKNLRAFAKLYGYVKYFHPSDEASEINWDNFAILGVRKVKQAKTTDELKTALEELFLPIAPTVQIYHSNEPPKHPAQKIPNDVNDLKVVAWQHHGVNLTEAPSIYKSIRLNRENKFLTDRSRIGFGTVTQAVDATPYQGKEIKLKASVRVNVSEEGNQAQLWLRVDRENKKQGFFNNMHDRPIRESTWKEYEIIGSVDKDALRIVFGGFLKGYGKVWIDEFGLFFKDTENQWKLIEIKNPGFEEENAYHRPEQWFANSPGYSYRVTEDNPYLGQTCLLIEKEKKYIDVQQLFDQSPNIGEVIQKNLDRGLWCRVPLALYSDEEKTLGKNEKYPFSKLASDLRNIKYSSLTADDESVRLGNVVIAWNVFQHFYPYWDVVDTDWDLELTRTLTKSMANMTEMEFYYTFSQFIAALQDGHAHVGSEKISPRLGSFPFLVDWIENQVIVVAPGEMNDLKVGDIVMAVDDKKAEKILIEDETYISGSPQRKRISALMRFGYGILGTKAKLTIKRNKKTFTVDVERQRRAHLSEFTRASIEQIEENIYYVNLTEVSSDQLREMIDNIAKAKGVIFDMRGYPRGNDWILRNLLSQIDTSNSWMRVPHIIYPDRENIAGYSEMGWNLFPMEPHIEGKVVFITNALAISYADSMMGFVEHYKLGDIVGQPTAGTNGNVNSFALPGGFQVTWTGMKVVKHDGSQFHLIGTLPTHPVQRTRQKVIDGEDEFLETALKIIK